MTNLDTISSDASSADWVAAWATVAYTVAAIVAGMFAWRAWSATKQSLNTAQEMLRIEQDRRGEERTERLARARVEASRFEVRESTQDSGDGSMEIIAENKAGVPFEGVELIVAYWDDEPREFVAYGNSAMWRDAVGPHSDDVMRTGPLPPGRRWYWELFFTDLERPAMAQDASAMAAWPSWSTGTSRWACDCRRCGTGLHTARRDAISAARCSSFCIIDRALRTRSLDRAFCSGARSSHSTSTGEGASNDGGDDRRSFGVWQRVVR